MDWGEFSQLNVQDHLLGYLLYTLRYGSQIKSSSTMLTVRLLYIFKYVIGWGGGGGGANDP